MSRTGERENAGAGPRQAGAQVQRSAVAPGKSTRVSRSYGTAGGAASGSAPVQLSADPAPRATSGDAPADEFGGVLAGSPTRFSNGDAPVQRVPLADTLRDQLTQTDTTDTSATSTAGPPVQRALAGDLRGMLEIYGPVHYDGIIAAVHAAPTAERQAVLADSSLRALINQRLDDEWAQTVFSSLLEGSQEWENPPANDFFTYFVTNGGNGTLPDTATMNCWESIMYAAYLAGQVDAAWIASFYQTAMAAGDPNAAVWSQLGFSTSLPTYAPPGGNPAQGSVVPRPGQLLFYFTGGSVPGHVAVSLGGDQAISLWSQPNNIDSVQRIGVTDLAGTVHVGDPPW